MRKTSRRRIYKRRPQWGSKVPRALIYFLFSLRILPDETIFKLVAGIFASAL